jgi:hypothetical protein
VSDIDPMEYYNAGQWHYDLLQFQGSQEEGIYFVGQKILPLLADGKFEVVNLILQYVDPSMLLYPEMGLAFLACTYACRAALPGRPALWGRVVRHYVKERGIEASRKYLEELL